MREIKFRTWNTIQKEWYIGPYEYIWMGSEFVEMKQDGLIFCEYTGLKDKNGVEIYEGDILKTTGLYQEHFIVEYSDRSFELYDGKDGIVSDEHNIWDAYEIIGNIYENPELLI